MAPGAQTHPKAGCPSSNFGRVDRPTSPGTTFGTHSASRPPIPAVTSFRRRGAERWQTQCQTLAGNPFRDSSWAVGRRPLGLGRSDVPLVPPDVVLVLCPPGSRRPALVEHVHPAPRAPRVVEADEANTSSPESIR